MGFAALNPSYESYENRMFVGWVERKRNPL